MILKKKVKWHLRTHTWGIRAKELAFNTDASIFCTRTDMRHRLLSLLLSLSLRCAVMTWLSIPFYHVYFSVKGKRKREKKNKTKTKQAISLIFQFGLGSDLTTQSEEGSSMWMRNNCPQCNPAEINVLVRAKVRDTIKGADCREEEEEAKPSSPFLMEKYSWQPFLPLSISGIPC